MTVLTLELTTPPDFRIDMRSLTPCQLVKKNNRDIARQPLLHGNQKIRVGDLFKVTGRDKTRLRILSDSPRLDAIGASMQQGTIHIEGQAGAYTGMEMQSGELVVLGNTGVYTGAGLINGKMTIQGDTGDFLGAALAGERQGMRGGSIVVKGNTGDRVGDRLRRGIIIVHGDSGDFSASRMIAGSLVILGKAGQQTGFNMRRGSVLLQHQPISIPDTFNFNGSLHLPFLKVFTGQLKNIDHDLSELESTTRIKRYLGDIACDGQGEILLRE